MIEVAPLAFMRGRTLADAFVILDEAQNTTCAQMRMVLTRLGENSRMVVTGDTTQIDLPPGQLSGLVEAEQVLAGVEGVAICQFSDADVVRHPWCSDWCRPTPAATLAHRPPQPGSGWMAPCPIGTMNRAEQLRIPAQIAVAALVAYSLGFWFTSLFPGYLPKIGGLWSAISAVVVTQVTRKDAASSASLRILGSAIGAITSATYLTFLPFHPLGMATAIFATVMICAAINVPSHGRLAAITVIVVMVTGSLDPALSPGLNALLRFLESSIGTGVALLTVWLWPGSRSQPGGDA